MSAGTAEQWQQMVAEVRGAAPTARLAVHSRAARRVGELLSQGLPPGVERLRVMLLRSVTVETLVPSLVAELALLGFAAEVEIGPFGSVAQEILSPASRAYTGGFDVCAIVALAEHVLPEALGHAAVPEESLDGYARQVEQLAGRFGGLVVACTLASPAPQVAPLLAAHTPGAGRHALSRANQRLAELAARRANVTLCDVDGLERSAGAQRFWSPRDLATSAQPFSAEGLGLLAARLASVCLLSRRTPIKCVVVDCDNTLWGGIIGEDGMGGIKLGESYPGWCFQQFQAQLAQLNRLGFLLAINSKNNEVDVRAVFDQHPGMLLRPEQIAAWRVNWTDKVTNLEELAEELNIGVDSFLFVDDSPFELDFVRQRLPQVRCALVPDKPWLLPELLPGVVGLDRLRITDEDRKKTRMYAEEGQRRKLKSSAGSIEEYLTGLDIHMTFEPFDPKLHVARAAQLTQKTNQFNLTTRRYSEADLLKLHADGARIYTASLRDRFGEYGRVVLAIVEPLGNGAAALRVFLMSCRVIGRGVEESFLRLVMRELRAGGLSRLEAEFIPSAKNAVSADFLKRAGLSETGRDADGRVAYTQDLSGDIAGPSPWLTVHRQDERHG